jgi:hypothetical protein
MFRFVSSLSGKPESSWELKLLAIGVAKKHGFHLSAPARQIVNGEIRLGC